MNMQGGLFVSQVNILGFAGSLRQESFNKAALRAAQGLLPEGAGLEIFDLAPIPFFNEDLEAEGLPQAVAEFRQKIATADALLIATPEYNYSLPPVLKNALDWASRGSDSPLIGKVAGIMSASTGMFGGSRAQYHLRQVCVRLDVVTFNQPETFITFAERKFNEHGNLTDERTRRHLARLLQALVAHVKQ